MATEQALRYIVEANDRDLKELQKSVRQTNKAIGDDTAKASSKGSKGLGLLGKAGIGAGLALGVGLFKVAKIGWAEFAEGEQIAARTRNVISSTGKSAGVTAKEVERLAGALSAKSGVDDEAIQSGQNVLLTFTKVRNEAGNGAKTFDRASVALTDMAVAMGKDPAVAAKALGRALQDPIGGLGGLSKAGIVFTDQQEKQIKAMVAAGDTAGAQAFILGQVENRYKGAAEAAGNTLPGQINKAKVAFENIAGELVGAVAPALANTASTLAENLPAAMAIARRGAEAIGPIVRTIFTGIKDVVISVYRAIGPWIEEHRADLQTIGGALKTLGTVAATIFKVVIIPAARLLWSEVLPRVLGIAVEAIAGIIRIIGTIATVSRTSFGWLRDNVGPYLQTAWQNAQGPIGFIRGAINNVDTAIDAVRSGLGWLRDNAGRAAGGFRDAVSGPLDKVRDAARLVSQSIQNIVEGFRWLLNNAKRVGDLLGSVGSLFSKIPGVGDVATGFNSALARAKRERMTGGAVGAGGLAPQTSSLLGQIRSMFGNVVLSSGFRSRAENERVGGAPNSDHLTGRALDLVPATGWSPASVAHFDRIVQWLASLPSVRWIGWRGVPGHGPYDHLHVSTFHEGGEFRASRPGGEGLALLRDREVVLTPEQLAAGGPLVHVDTIVVRDEGDVDRVGTAVVRALGIR